MFIVFVVIGISCCLVSSVIELSGWILVLSSLRVSICGTRDCVCAVVIIIMGDEEGF